MRSIHFVVFLLLFATHLAGEGLPDAYRVEEFRFVSSDLGEDLPHLDSLEKEQVTLSFENGTFTAVDADHQGKLHSLGELNGKPALYTSGALVAIARQVIAYYDKLGYMGIFVAVDPQEIDRYGLDRRPNDHRSLTFQITAYRVGAINTVASGPKFDTVSRLNHSGHEGIIENSPLQAGAGVEPSSLLRRDLLDEYVYFLSRYPGRRVDILISGLDHPGRVQLDYVISEDKPWSVYANASNSGSRSDSRWVERVGFIHHKVFGEDIIAALDYATTDFDAFHFVRGYLEAPCFSYNKLRWYLEGNWSEFTSSEFGLFDDEFTGMQQGATAGIKLVLLQHRDFFLDLLASANWRYIRANNKLLGMKGKAHLLIPRIGLAAERVRVDSSIIAHLTLETNLSGVVDTEDAELAKLGRTMAENDWWVLKGSVLLSKFLDANPQKPLEQHHEVALSGEGQYAFAKRLIPQLERSIGGFDTVRGYPQGVASGPNALIGRGEYRYHHYFPDQQLHLIGRAFADAGRTMITDRVTGEIDKSLTSAGLGVEVEWRKNVRFRSEVGVALHRVLSPNIAAGNAFGHFDITVIY